MRLEVDIKKKVGNFTLCAAFSCENTVTAILGQSGCGKSMTLKCIAGIETPDEGKIVLDGRILFDAKRKINVPAQKRNIGYMFQDYALFPNMTVRENIEIAQKGKAVENSVLERFHIAKISELYPSQLSGGQKQRAAMARMLAANPDVILLDEPFSALDSHLRWKLEQEVKQILLEENKPTVLVSHDRDEIYRLSEYTGVMSEGTLKNVMETKEFFAHPKTCEAAMLSGCKNILKVKKSGERKVTLINGKHKPDSAESVSFDTAEPVWFEEGYIGIRAHSFQLCDADSRENNSIQVVHPEIIEEPFEWTVSFGIPDSTEKLHWKISKEQLKNPQEEMPDFIWIPSEKIMLLSE